MSGGMALWSGFSSFFSIWQICIMQISPFLIAYMLGLYLLTLERGIGPGTGTWFILPGISYTAGFSLLYSLLIASGLEISRALIYNLGSLRLAAGFMILFAALYILLPGQMNPLRNRHRPLFISVLSLLIGICFAIIYSPCITPALSDIMGLASQRESAATGWYLALLYGLGISIALLLTALAVILLLARRTFVQNHLRLFIMACGLVVLVPALLNISGLMRHYKALILGFLV